ncbi:endo-1,4-beta-xylanase [Pelagicoccus sp. SDUM812003]|uniref:endo-1,4-beta-xylanase n=1 Tax=Pelagicoccus sp. SDUM812003 TaxID=3041267 RepID=UPI00280CB09A|nr:endo-1,4-beta-xylanase [Pelagicoccus sp. SDUM812003]MDQ8204140.1 endo-1,4-beta-xylanase [Pelagicoccus sp. SDUM812003]
MKIRGLCNRQSPTLLGRLGRLFLSKPRTRLASLLLASSLIAAGASAQVTSNGFEDGSTQGWGPRGTVTVVNTTADAYTGTNSLLTSGSTATWNGPSRDVTSLLLPDETYQISAWVKMAAGQAPADLKFTVQRNEGSTANFTQVNAPVTVTDSAWVQLQGSYSYSGTATTQIQIYLEGATTGISYYMDDFLIEGQAPNEFCPTPHDQSGLMSDFELGGTDGWFPRGGSVSTTVVSTDSYDGDYSLEVTGRTATWNGASIDTMCKMHKGDKYLISLWVKLLPGQDPANLRLSLQSTFDGQTSYSTVIGDTQVTSDAWVNLITEYTFSRDAESMQLYVEANSATVSFYIDEFLLMYLPPIPIQTDIPSVKDVWADSFPIGAAINPGETVGQHAELLLKHFASVTADNAMKWSSLQPTEGNFNWGPADTIADFARDNGLLLRGHTLVWHSQVPDWVFEDSSGNPLTPGDPDDRALVIERMRTHITAVMERYADVVTDWDVVNEVIDSNQPGGLRISPWLEIVGPEFIDLAFQFADEVGTGAGLYINDYSTTNPAKRDALKAVVQGLLDRGVPVDGVGHQMHMNVEYPPLDLIRQTLETFAEMGLDNQVTELDISAYTNSTDTSPVSQETLIEQGYRYRDIFELYRELSDIISTITLWGMADDNTWLKTFPITRDDKPLLFDEDLQAKWAYWGIVDPSVLPLTPKSLSVTKGSPRINAMEEIRWKAIAETALVSEGEEDSWASFKALWEGDTLYLQVEVDDRLRYGDSVEVFVEGMTYRFDKYGRQRPAGANAMITPTWTGYRLEASIPLGIELQVDDQVKFDVRVTDAASAKQASWSDIRHGQDESDENAGTLTMMDEKNIEIVLPGRATIDGYMDKRWRHASPFETQTFVSGDSGATAEVRLMYDRGSLYLYALVSDPVLSKASPNPWEQDSIEIFIDENNAQTTSYDGDDAQYRINFDNEVSFGGAASADRIESATRVVDGGYVVEARIDLGDADSFVGFDIQVNDDGAGDGIRTSVATWNDVSGQAYQDASQFGALKLLGRSLF